jgi:hypothetical protein
MKEMLCIMVALSCAFGCQRETKKENPAKDTTLSPVPQVPKEQPAIANPIGGIRGPAAEMLGYLPQDSSIIVGFSATKATRSKLFVKYQDKILASAAQEMAEVKEKCGIDMMADMREVVVAVGKDIQNPDSAVIAVKGNYDRKKVEGCIVKMGGKIEGTVMTSPNGKVSNMFWIANDTFLISKGRTSDELKGFKEAGNVTQNKELMELVGKVDSNATFWVAGTIPPEVAGAMGPMGTPPNSGYLGVNLGSAIGAKAGMTFNTEDEAKGMSTMIEMALNMGKQQPEMKDILDAVNSTLSGNTITINVKITGAQVDQMMSMTTGMF